MIPQKIISLMFCLDTEQGHIFGYNKIFGDVVQSLGWHHTAVTRAEARVKERPTHWSFTLGSTNHLFRQSFLLKLEKFYLLIVTLRRYLTTACKDSPQQKVILFLEWFNIVHLLALLVALIFLPQRQNYQIWMMYRLAIAGNKDRRLKLIHKAYTRLTGSPMLFLTDSELVAPTIKIAFDCKPIVLPIPHTHALSQYECLAGQAIRNTIKSDYLVWWPGMPAKEKGLASIQRLCEQIAQQADPKINVLVSEKAQISSSRNITGLASNLSDAEYWAYMAASNVILLPYNANAYGERTSGIFTEAVVAGKLPLVAQGTWAAHELQRYNLQDLIVDWHRADLPEFIILLCKNKEVQQKLEKMKNTYSAFHSMKGLAETLLKIVPSLRQS